MGIITNTNRLFIPITENKMSSLLPQNGAHYTDSDSIQGSNTSFPLTENKNVYIEYSFDDFASRTVYGNVVFRYDYYGTLSESFEVKKYDFLNLAPVFDRNSITRCYVLSMSSISNDIIKNWWNANTVRRGAAVCSMYDYASVELSFNGESFEGEKTKSSFGIILHTKEEENLFVFSEHENNYGEPDEYIYAALDFLGYEDVVTFSIEKVG